MKTSDPRPTKEEPRRADGTPEPKLSKRRVPVWREPTGDRRADVLAAADGQGSWSSSARPTSYWTCRAWDRAALESA